MGNDIIRVGKQIRGGNDVDEVFDVEEFLREMENYRFNNIVSEYELDGIRFHPDTNVGEKVIQ